MKFLYIQCLRLQTWFLKQQVKRNNRIAERTKKKLIDDLKADGYKMTEFRDFGDPKGFCMKFTKEL